MADSIRNVAILAHDGAGKTALTEALDRLCNPERASKDGSTSRLDSEPEEKKRNITLTNHLAFSTVDGVTFNWIDTPGFSDFLVEADRAARVCEGALLIVSAISGVKNQTELHWGVLESLERPVVAVVNKMDKERADFLRSVDDMEKALGCKPVALHLPIGVEAGFKGVVDLVSMKAHVYEGAFGKYVEKEIPAEQRAEADTLREHLVEAIAESDDQLLEKYLEAGTLTQAEVLAGLDAAVKARKFVPVLAAAARNGIGVRDLLETLLRSLPGPSARKEIAGTNLHGDPVTRPATREAPFAAQVFKTTVDPFAGRLSIMRIYAGHLARETPLFNSSRRVAERAAHVYKLDGSNLVEVKEAFAGDIIALQKLKETRTGDTLCTADEPFVITPFPEPKRVFSVAIDAHGAPEDKLATALHKILEEDPLLEMHRENETGETLLRGMGNVHLEVVQERIKRKSGLDILLKAPHPAYHETITVAARAQGRYKRQTGGHGQFGDCWLEVVPLPRNGGFEFEDAIVGGVIPRNFIPSVEKGVVQAKREGPLGAFPVTDIKVKLYDGSYHSVDSSDMAFQIAGSLGFKNAVAEARPILLEPMVKMEIVVPEEFMGAVIGDMNSRRGKIVGMEPTARGTVIRATAPLAEVLMYSPELRSITSGAGYFTMEVSHYEEVPTHLTRKLLDQRAAERAQAKKEA